MSDEEIERRPLTQAGISDEQPKQNINEWGEANRAELAKLTEDRGEFTIPRDVIMLTPSDMWQAFMNAMAWKMEEGKLELSHHVNVRDGSVTIRWQPAVPSSFKGSQQH